MNNFTIKDKSIESAVKKVLDHFHTLGIRNATRTDVIRFLLEQKKNDIDVLRKKVEENNRRSCK